MGLADEPRPRLTAGAPLTPLERDATCQLLAAIINDSLETYGLTGQQEAAIVRALAKLSRTS
jgi:hypothetical protein